MKPFTILAGEKKGTKPGGQIVRCLRIKRRWGAFFAQGRERAGLTYEEIERKLKLLPGTYQAWERGFCLPESKRIIDVLSCFDVSFHIEFQALFNQILDEEQRLHDGSPLIG